MRSGNAWRHQDELRGAVAISGAEAGGCVLLHTGGSVRCRLTMRRMKYSAAARQTITAMMEASGPNCPPVRMRGPLNEPRNKPSFRVFPETDMLKIEPS